MMSSQCEADVWQQLPGPPGEFQPSPGENEDSGRASLGGMLHPACQALLGVPTAALPEPGAGQVSDPCRAFASVL